MFVKLAPIYKFSLKLRTNANNTIYYTLGFTLLSPGLVFFYLFSSYFNGWKGNLSNALFILHAAWILVITIEMIKAMRNENELHMKLSLDQLDSLSSLVTMERMAEK